MDGVQFRLAGFANRTHAPPGPLSASQPIVYRESPCFSLLPNLTFSGRDQTLLCLATTQLSEMGGRKLGSKKKPLRLSHADFNREKISRDGSRSKRLDPARLGSARSARPTREAITGRHTLTRPSLADLPVVSPLFTRNNAFASSSNPWPSISRSHICSMAAVTFTRSEETGGTNMDGRMDGWHEDLPYPRVL